MLFRVVSIIATVALLAACSPSMNGGQGFKNSDGKYGGPATNKSLGSTAICDSPNASGATENCRDLKQSP